jgi:hypothetical protein
MAQKSKLRLASLALFALFAVTLGGVSLSFAQSPTTDRMVGDWRLFVEKSRTGAPNTAGTPDLSGRTAELWVTCSTYEVQFDLRWDEPFISSFPEGAFESIAFMNVDRADYFRGVILTQHPNGGSIFFPFVKEVMRGSTLMVCPKKNDKDPACLSFSLKGLTAALKAICPKR